MIVLSVPDLYSIDTCQVIFDGCAVEFYFTLNNADPILIANQADYACPNSLLPWIIAGSLVGLILLVGILALIILKICLIVFVSLLVACHWNVQQRML